MGIPVSGVCHLTNNLVQNKLFKGKGLEGFKLGLTLMHCG